MGKTNCDCVVLDLSLPDMSGFEVLEKMRIERDLADIPVVVFTGRQLSPEEDAKLHSMARSIVVKGVESPERLLDETALFLHRVVTDLPPEKHAVAGAAAHSSDEDLIAERCSLVDDDAPQHLCAVECARARGMKVLTATARQGGDRSDRARPDLAMVLMDIMMPEMDGYRTIAMVREIRPIAACRSWRSRRAMVGTARNASSRRHRLPGQTGGIDQLLSALRTWLHR